MTAAANDGDTRPPAAADGAGRPPAAFRPTPAARRAAQIEKLSGRQAELKQEAAERRRIRAEQEASAPPPAPKRPARRAR